MLTVFGATLSPMLTMFLCLATGYVCRKKNLIPENSDAVISALENYVFVPALVFGTFSTYCTATSLREYSHYMLYCIFAFSIALLIAFLLAQAFQKKNYYIQNIYKYSLAFANFGFVGNAIVPQILGADDSGILYKYMLYTLPLQIAVYTWGIFILIPKEKRKTNPLKSLLNPVFISITAGIVFGLFDITKYMPQFIITTIDYLSGCMVPAAMILTGFVVGGHSAATLLKNKKVYALTLLRLFIIPAVVLTAVKLIGADRNTILFTFFAFATPFGINTIIFPAFYGEETNTGASMALISHLLCILSIPIMYTLLTMVVN